MAGKGYNAGSVNAKINLDTSQFDEAMKELKKQTESIRQTVGQSAASTSSQIDNLVDSVNTLQEQQSKLYDTTVSTSEGLKKEAENIKKLSKETENSSKNIEKTAEATAKLNEEMKKSSKQSQLMLTDLEKAFTKDLMGAINNAQKIAKGSAVALKPIFDELDKKYGKQHRNTDHFRETWLRAFRVINAEFKSLIGNLDNVPIGKGGYKFNAINISNLKTVEEVQKALQAVEDTTNKVTNATEKTNDAHQKNIDTIKKETQATKELVDLQQQFNKDFLKSYKNNLRSNGASALFRPMWEGLREQYKDIVTGRKEFEGLMINAISTLTKGTYPLRDGEENVKFATLGGQAVGAIRKLKSATDEVSKANEKATETTKKLTEEQKPLQEELQKTESQIKKTADALQTQFSHYLYNKLKPHAGSQLFADPIVSQMKDMFSSVNESKFDQLMYRALKDNGVKTKLMGSSEIFDLKGLTKPAGDLKKATEEIINSAKQASEESVKGMEKVAESTKKATEATKELKEAQLDLSGKTKYSVAELLNMYDQLPKKMQNAMRSLSRIVEKNKKNLYPSLGNDDYSEDVKYLYKNLPLKSTALEDLTDTTIHGIGIFRTPKEWKEIEKVLNLLTKKFGVWYPEKYLEANNFNTAAGGGNRRTNNKVIRDANGKIISAVNKNFEELNFALKELQEMEIVSRKTGEAVKELGVSEEQTATKTQKITNETKQLGETAKLTANQIKVLIELFDHFQYKKGLGDNIIPFAQNYKFFEEEYKNLFTKLDVNNPKLRSRIKKQFQKQFKEFTDMLGVDLVQGAFEGALAEGTPKYSNFLGHRIGSYDISNLIDESEFNRLIGKTEKLNVDLEGTSNQIKKAVTQANNLANAIQNVGAKAETSTNLVKKLGLATDEFGFVYLGELISNFERLPVALQKAVTNVARVLEKGHRGLYPAKGKSSRRDFQSYMSDLIFTSFPISQAGIPFNANDPRYHSLQWFQPSQTGMESAEQLEEQKKLFNQILQTFGRFYPIEYQVVQGMERWGANTRFVHEELQYTLDTLELMEPRVKSIARALDAFKANGLKFMTKDQWNSPYFLSKLLQEGNGFEYYSRIKPKNEKDRYYSSSDRQFLEKLMKEIFNPYIKGEDRYRPIDAHHIFKYPAFGQLTTHDMINMPYGTEYIQHYKDGTKKEYEKFVKYAQTQMIRALKPLGITLSTELARTSEQGVRVWLDNIGKFRNMGSLDLSNMIRFDDFRSAMAYVDRLTNGMVSLGYGMDKTAMKTKQLSYALKENVNWQQRVTREQEKALIKAKKLAESKNPDLKVGVSLWGTAEEFRNAELGFRNLIKVLDNINSKLIETSAVEENAVKSTEKLSRSVKKLGTSFRIGFKPLVGMYNEGATEFLFNPSITGGNGLNTLIENFEKLTDLQKTGLKKLVDLYFVDAMEGIGDLKYYDGFLKAWDKLLKQLNLKISSSIGRDKTLTGQYEIFEKYVELGKLLGRTDFSTIPRDVTSTERLQIIKKIMEETIVVEKQLETQTKKVSEVFNNINKLSIGTTWTLTFKSAGQAVKEVVTCLDDFTGKVPQVIDKENQLASATGRMGNALKNIISLVETVPSQLFYGAEFTSKFFDVSSLNINDKKTQAELLGVMLQNATNQATNLKNALSNVSSETQKLSEDYIKVGKSAKTASEEVKQLVMAVEQTGKQHTLFGSTGLFSNWGKVPNISSKEFLEAFVAYRKFKQELNQPVGISAYQSLSKLIERVLEFKKITDMGIKFSNFEPIENLPVVLEKVSESSKKASEGEERFERQTRKTANTVKTEWRNIFQQLNDVDKKIKEMFGRKIDSRNLRKWSVNAAGDLFRSEPIENSTNALKTFDNTVITTANDVYTKLYTAMKKVYEMNKNSEEPMALPLGSWKSALAEIKAFELRYTALMNRMYELSRKNYMSVLGDKENTGYGKLLEQMGGYFGGVINKKRYFTDIADMVSPEGSKGRINVEGYSDYVARINEIKQALESTSISTNKYKESLTLLAEAIKLNANELTGFVGKAEGAVQAMTKLAEANERFSSKKSLGQKVTDLDTMLYGNKGINNKGLGQSTGLTATLEHLTSLSDKHSSSLSKYKQNVVALERSFVDLRVAMSKGEISSETYEKEIDKLTGKVKRLREEIFSTARKANLFEPSKIKETDGAIKQSTGSLREFGKEMSNGEKYANNLYRGLQKARSVIISLKTIGRMMGGMAVWNFAFDMVEQAKQTYIAKNEIESLLNKNSKVDASGIQLFNHALDGTVERFQKVNKYNLGETAASIGLEFNLSAKEMAKSLPIIAMIQSEYVRAGRTVEEAGLAVKDILQGEFMRLSRETGVGKEELLAAGWSGDNKDVLSLMAALEKIGKSRHWDLFAEKATSLNDVLTITKSRFAELGAEIGTTAEPLIVGSFNAMLSAVDTLKKGFEGLGSFGKNFVMITGAVAGVIGLTSAYLTLAKGMGTVELATMGWTKSLLANMLQLNHSEVVMHGFWKTLLATTSGVKAATVAELGFGKSLVSRVLGLNQALVAEKGFSGAIVETISRLKEGNKATDDAITKLNFLNKAKKEGINVEKVSVLSKDKSRIITEDLINKELNRSQRLAYMTTNLKYARVAEMGRAEALLRTAFSARVLKAAFIGITTVAVAAWFASVAMWADAVKKRMESFYDLVQNGDDKIKTTQNELENYDNKLSELSESDPAYALTQKNRDTVQRTLDDLQLAKSLADDIQKTDKELTKSDDLRFKGGLNALYAENGVNIEKQGQEYLTMRQVKYDMLKAEKEKSDFEYASLQHIAEHVRLMKQGGIDEEKRVKYITEYSAKAKEVAENLKKFNQGDISAGVYALLGKLELYWIDLWNDKDFINFWEAVKKTFKDLEPTLISLKNNLLAFGRVMLRYFSTEQGRWVAAIAGFSTAVGLLGWKFRGTLKSIKELLGGFKTMGGKLKDMVDKWRKASDEIEKAKEKIEGKGKDEMEIPEKSTGGITKDKKPKLPDDYEWKDLGKDIKKDFMGEARRFAKVAGQIALAMGVLAVAIASLSMPMLALALTGEVFKHVEPQIRSGIEGLKLIAPVIAVFLPPVVAVMVLMDKAKGLVSENIIYTAKQSAKVIAAGMFLVAEAIVLLIPSMLAIAALGWVNDVLLGDGLSRGIEAIEMTGKAVMAMVPVVPIFVAAIALGAIAIATDGVGLAVVVGGIALGMLGVAAAIVTLSEPLLAIGALGAIFTDLGAVQKGTEAIKLCAEALTYVEQAMAAFAKIVWEDLAANIANLIGVEIGASTISGLNDLTKEGGFFTQLNSFFTAFNQLDIVPPNADKITAVSQSATGISSIGDAMALVKQAMDNLPAEFKNEKSNPLTSYNAETGKTEVSEGSSEGFFDQFKEPIRQLKTFIDDFNNSDEFAIEPPNPDRVNALTQAASMIGSIKTAVENVKAAMGGIADAQWDTSMAEGGLFGAVGNFLFHSSGNEAINNGQTSGAYKSSLGSSFQEMENVISDITTFQSRVSGMGNGGEENSNVEGLTNMVTAVSNAIQQLQNELSAAAPQVKASAKAIGSGIKDGVNEGMSGMGNAVSQRVVQSAEQAKPYAYTYGQGIGGRLTSGYKAQLKLKEATQSEVGYTFEYLDNKVQDFYDKGAKLGGALARGYKENGLENKSPGLMARTTLQEMYYIGDFLEQGMTMLPQKAIALGEALSSNFNPSLDMGGLSVDELSQFQSGLDTVSSMANTTDLQTSTAFMNMNTNVTTSMTGMTSTVNNSFNGIQQNATLRYNQLVNTTRVSLSSMLSQTTRNINAIKTSWRGMQVALIQSAENIRNETSSKISQLESNMASFWNKVQNPALLLGAGGGTGSIPRRSGGRVIMPRTGTNQRIHAAGSGHTSTGIRKRNTGRNDLPPSLSTYALEYLECLMNGGNCAMGGWNYNWTPNIRDALLKWHTHFGEIYDDVLTVGKFENDDFPVRGNATIALRYIQDAISQTDYEGYFDSKYGSPLEAWNAGHFNCVDGALVAIALANAFGFTGGYVGYGSWGGIGHGFAVIPGLGVIDATAIQNGYGLTSPKVTGYPSAGTITRNSSANKNPQTGDTHNYGDVNININIYGDDVEVDEKKVDKSTAKQIIDLLGINPSTGR